MKSRTPKIAAWKGASILRATIVCALLGVHSYAGPQSKDNVAAPAQKTFATPDEAAKALIEAATNYDVPALLEILGPEGKDLVASGDPAEDKIRAAAFAALAREKSAVSVDSARHRAELLVGKDDWPMPIPMIKQKNGTWYYDSKSGRTEVLYRRIGENELNTIGVCRGFVEAQREYALTKHDGAQVNQYAQRIISTTGKQDGLAWRGADGSWGGPVGEEAAKALELGYLAQGQPYHGYFFKVLKGQGPAAPLGQMDFVVNDAMIGGFALVAAPAQYRVTGVETFMVSHDGIVYQKDLGPDTLNLFKAMERFDPDRSWRVTNDEP